MFKFIKSVFVLIFVFIFLSPSALALTDLVTIKPEFIANATASSADSITIEITSGINIDHVAIISGDQSTFIGMMIFDYGVGSYTITNLKAETQYVFWIKASSVPVSPGQSSPNDNITWQKVSVITPKNKTIFSLPNSGMMCLTFDDGYGETYIKKILDCLRENNVQATFFIIGELLKVYPELWQQAILDGHEIAYHSMKHEQLTTYNDQQILNDIATWNSTAHEVLGNDYIIPLLARLPGGGGNNSSRILKLFNSIGYNIIAWNSDSYTGVIKDSTDNTAQKISDYVLNHAAIGTINLQHFNQYDALSVSLYITTLKEKYTLGTISDAILSSSYT